jgi:DNA-binding NtrC family response regulator
MQNGIRHVLIVDASPQTVAYGIDALAGMEVEAVTTPAAALERVVGSTFDAVLLDPAQGDDDDGALALLHRMRTIAPDTVVVIWSEHPTVEFAVRAMRSGALDVLKKTSEVAEIRSVVERAISHGALAREVRRLRGEVERARGLGEVIGESALMRNLLAMIDRVAASDATVLIVGESGTGKELLSRTIHRVGPRRDGPFVAFDCSALAPSLIEAELFGHEKGAFTGANRARRGLFREANGCTIFLD